MVRVEAPAGVDAILTRRAIDERAPSNANVASKH